AQDRVESRVVYGEDEDAILEGVGCRLLREDEDLDKDLMENKQSEGADEADEQDRKDEPEAETEGKLVQLQSDNLHDSEVSLDPNWSITIEPIAPCTTCDEIMGRYSASDFVLRVNKWLLTHSMYGTNSIYTTAHFISTPTY
ncbi:hypothetical protein FRC11_014606, partial [Ceratobasidium sp. 423]